MACCATQIHQSALSQEDDVPAIYIIQIHLWFNSVFRVTIVVIQPGNIDLNIKMTYVANNRLILHLPEMFFSDQVAATGSCNDDIGFFYRLTHLFYCESIHRSLQGADG